MPKIFEYFGFIFFFYSNEHEPIHVHVIKGDRESVFELIINNGKLVGINVRNGHLPSLSEKDISEAKLFISKYYKNIVNKWVNFFLYKKRVINTKITKKI